MESKVVCIVGLGYVGLPLAKAFSKHLRVIGFDVNEKRINELRTKCSKDNLELTADPTKIKMADFVLICVPTPVKRSKDPDLSYIISAAEIVGRNLKKGAIVVLESTVYPGVTEELVEPILEAESGFKCGVDFKVGYSPERINPGDEVHTAESITKVVAGMDEESTASLADLYGLITKIFKAKDIKTAEAAKVIENIQRDLNIALVNELTLIFHRMGLDTNAVLDAASTKWNFIRFSPGMVGGHCIPVDPYYLVYKAKELDYHPQVILAGRAINDHMPKYIADLAIKGINDVGKPIKGSKVIILGLTYKENVPDIRESPAKDIVKNLKDFGIVVYGYDPLLSKEEIERFGIIALSDLHVEVDCIVVTVGHNEFKSLSFSDMGRMMHENPVLIDVRGLFDEVQAAENGFYYKKL